MRVYVDTSVLVAASTREPATERALAWLDQQALGSLLSSEWVVAEYSAAQSVKLRMGAIDANYRAEALARFRRLMIDAFEIAPVEAAHFRTAAHFADHHPLRLRAGDALRLAIASEQGATIVTLDQRLATAGPALGVATRLL